MIHGNEKGSSAVEFTLAAILFFAVLFSIVEYAIMAYVNLTMQHAVREGTRFVVTGQAEEDSTWDKTLDSRYLRDNRFRAMVAKIHSQSMGFFDRVLDPDGDIVVEDVSGTDIKKQFEEDFNEDGDTDDPGEKWYAYTPGDPGEIIVIRLHCTWPVITPLIRPFFSGGNYHFTVASTMRNEQFD
jgi:hypothetical protein